LLHQLMKDEKAQREHVVFSGVYLHFPKQNG